MKRACLAFLIVGLAFGGARADTTWVAGGNVSGQWTRDGSPYMIQDSIVVAADDSLLIGPGVTVFFTGPFGLWVADSGLIRAEGGEGDSIYFTTDTLSNPQRWLGVTVQTPARPVYFSYCVFEYAGAEAGPRSALYARNGTVEIQHCTFRNNRFPLGEGGGLCAISCDLYVAQCLFTGNGARNGGALAIFFCTAAIENCIFENNLGSNLGGAVDIWVDLDTSVEFVGCHFTNNYCVSYGGAVVVELCGPVFRDCVFSQNSAGQGGAIFGFASQGTILDGCLITDNHASTFGGGIYDLSNWRSFTMIGCVVARNDAQEGGGIYVESSSSPIIQNCTIVENSCAGVGAGLYYEDRPSTTDALRNTVIAFNTSGYGLACGLSPWIFYCALFGNEAGPFCVNDHPYQFPVYRINANGDSCDARFNIYLDPLFVDLAAGDYHLTEESPCIDAGDPSSPLDPDSTVADIGAFYFPQPTAAEFPVSVVRSTGLLGNYPNPFNATTVIEYELAAMAPVRLTVYDLLGRQTQVLWDGAQPAGRHSVSWNAGGLPSGVYVAVLETEDFRAARKLLLLR